MPTHYLDNRLDSAPAPILYTALCVAFARRSDGIELNSFGTGDCYTHLSHCGRSAQVFTGLGSQDYRLDFSEAGLMVAKGRTLRLDQAIAALITWLSLGSTVEELIAQHPSCEIRRPHSFAR